MKPISIFLICVMPLCACASGPSPEQTAKAEAINRGGKACEEQFAYGVRRAKCINDVVERYLGPGFPYPDLLAVMSTSRVAIAERFEKGEISQAQGEALYAKVKSDAQGEFARRQGQDAALDMQRAALIQSSRPVTCIPAGAAVNCF